MIKAIELLQTSNFAVVSFGDRVIDLESSHRAGIKSVGCTWGSRESDLLRNSFYTSHIIEQPLEIIDFLFDD
jgi:phosphoglycolate phosphatase